MNTFSELTALIPVLQRDTYGEWIYDKENDGTPEHPKRLPFVCYTPAVDTFVKTLYRYCEAHPEYEHTDYIGTLEKSGLWGAGKAENADVSHADAKLVIALLIRAVRAERFCDGALLECCKNGSILRWLRRLEAIDNE